ncbi:acyl-CoA thioesterase [Biformimicrobium ophioploci]|uniref:Acyl-CoA thioesterase II n=1 Tax=Biformimicrobium ophioploci TaxID=3036711 RepID=A0ABQ6LWL4_9GAMM|nr:thioesterase family protein [Microbulbifer sp. NKW57]GMG86422.1 acyl-CoA thioesterase II [Microbulbifer sp. NKW57]
MQFSDLMAQCRETGAAHNIPGGWGQGRATFGGLVAAMLYERMAAEVDAGSSLRALTVSFVAPATSGEVELRSEILRAGRSVTQVEGRIHQGGAPVLAALASFGAPRSSATALQPANAPATAAAEQGQALPYLEGLVPEFTQKFDYRITEGQLPFSGSKETVLGGWVRFSEPGDASAPVGIGHLLALIDAWPPVLLPMLSQPAPTSSLTWNLEFIEPMPAFSAGDWWRYSAELEQAADGYGVAGARLWNPDGKLVAFSRQAITVFA